MENQRRFLLTNDDGIDAPGLQALWKAATRLGQATIIAPLSERSGASHRVTTSAPIRLEVHRQQAFAVDGTPADCVRLGLYRLMPNADWILSGINAGGNLGADIHHSGTVAAVREAVVHGVPGIAVSHYRKRKNSIDWDKAVQWVLPVLEELLAKPPEPGTFWNINLPDSEDADRPRVIYCPVDPSPLPLHYVRQGDAFYYSGDYHNRLRRPGCDVDVCFRGDIAVSLIRLF